MSKRQAKLRGATRPLRATLQRGELLRSCSTLPRLLQLQRTAASHLGPIDPHWMGAR